MPQRAPWDPDFSIGHETIDAQHQGLLAACNGLADLCLSGDGQTSDQAFGQAFDQLKALLREHFETEAALWARRGQADLEDHRIECDEFEYLADEIITAEHFDRLELQRFVTLWCLGHIVGSAKPLRALLAGGNPP